MSLDVSLVIVGDELLEGRRADGNGPWLTRRLVEMGARVLDLSIVSDAAEEVARAVVDAASRAHVVIVSGGLGPTDDDGTRAGLARAAGTELVEDERALALVRAAQTARGFALDERRRREAFLPRGAMCLANPDGTAPGVEMRIGEATLWALPGVPREVRSMFESEVRPRLEQLGRLEGRLSVAFRVAGVREPDVADVLVDLAHEDAFALGLYPHEGELEVRVTARGTADEAATRQAAETARCRLDPVYPNVPLEEHVVECLRERGLSVTTAESMTGGLVARMLTGVPGASDVFRGGWVTYSDEWKAQALGVAPELLETRGAVSEPVARAMAEGARTRAGVDLAVAVTGFAGPDDGRTPDGETILFGTCFVALARGDGVPTVVHRHRAPHERRTVQRRAAVVALDLLRRAVAEGPGTRPTGGRDGPLSG